MILTAAEKTIEAQIEELEKLIVIWGKGEKNHLNKKMEERFENELVQHKITLSRIKERPLIDN